MTRDYDQRVLQLAPLWYWMMAELYPIEYRGSWGVFLRADWENEQTRPLWGLSIGARTLFRAPTLEEAVAARQELQAMIDAARLLVGVGRVRV